MISLDQVQLLEKKVESAVAKIVELQNENSELKQKCIAYKSRSEELQNQASSFEADQNKIEQGILHVLDRLNIVEDSVREVITNETTSENEVPSTNQVELSYDDSSESLTTQTSFDDVMNSDVTSGDDTIRTDNVETSPEMLTGLDLEITKPETPIKEPDIF